MAIENKEPQKTLEDLISSPVSIKNKDLKNTLEDLMNSPVPDVIKLDKLKDFNKEEIVEASNEIISENKKDIEKYKNEYKKFKNSPDGSDNLEHSINSAITYETLEKQNKNLDFIKESTLEKMQLPEKVINVFKNLGIEKEELKNLSKDLLDGKRTDIVEIPRFKDLNIKASFEIDKKDNSLLVFTPKFKEQDITRSVDSLKQIPGIISNKTDFINSKVLDKGFDFEKLINSEKMKKRHSDLENYAEKKLDIKESTPDTWLKTDKNLAKEMEKNNNFPIIKSGSDYFIGLTLKKIDNHSLNQHKFSFSKMSKDLDIKANKKQSISR